MQIIYLRLKSEKNFKKGKLEICGSIKEKYKIHICISHFALKILIFLIR